MNVEASISIARAISAPAARMSIESAPTFGADANVDMSTANASMQSINVGGISNPAVDNIFSLSEHEVGHVDSFDRVVPGNLAFTHTEVLWQAPQYPNSEPLSTQVILNDILESPQAEVMQEITFSPMTTPDRTNINNDYVVDVSKTQAIEETTQSDEQLVNVLSNITEDIVLHPNSTSDLEIPVNNPMPAISLNLDSQTTTELENKLTSDEITIPSRRALQEVEADAEQAERVKNALIATGMPQEEAEESTIVVLREALDKKGITKDLTEVNEELLVENVIKTVGKGKGDNGVDVETEEDSNSKLTQLAETYFEHDTKTDTLRQKIAEEAIVESVGQLTGERQNISGSNIAEKMPVSPQPEEVKSSILKDVNGDNDGSYENAIKEIKSIGTIYSAEHASSVISGILNNNHAVRAVTIKPSREASKEEVQKVLKTGVIFEDKSIAQAF